MSGMTNSAIKTKAFVSLSIDADAHDSLLKQLIANCNRHGISASWAIRDISAKPVLQAIGSSPVQHEVALLMDASLARADVSRSELLNRVARPLQLATIRNMGVCTLALTTAWHPRHIDLLTKYGVSVIRTPHVFSSRTTTGIRAICFGLWQVPVSVTLQGGGWMANMSQWRLVRKTIERAMLQGGWCHLRIDAAALATGDAVGNLRAVDRALEYLHQLQAAGLITVETLRGTAARLAPKRSAAAARSILRAA